MLSHLLVPAAVNVINAPVKLIICVEPKQGEWAIETFVYLMILDEVHLKVNVQAFF